MLDDGPVIEQARRGDETAWRTLYERHSDLVFRLAVRSVGERDAALDIVQETFVRASRAIGGFRGDATFRSWIARIAINETRSWLRKGARKREVSLELVRDIADEARPADEAAARSQMAQRAIAFVRTLPAQQRDTVLLRTMEGYAYREIAEMLGTTEGSVRVSYHHAIRKLRAHLAGAAGGRAGERTESERIS